jgi:hypothetical protein
MTEAEKSARRCFGGRATNTIKVKIIQETPGFTVGEIVTINYYGTFGGWSTDGRWVSFYSSTVMEKQ